MRLDPRLIWSAVSRYTGAGAVRLDHLRRETLSKLETLLNREIVNQGKLLKSSLPPGSAQTAATVIISRAFPMLLALVVVGVTIGFGGSFRQIEPLGQQSEAVAEARSLAAGDSTTPVGTNVVASVPTPTTQPADTASPTAATTDVTRQEAAARSPERATPVTPPNASALQAKFILASVAASQKSQQETGVPASVTLAQAALESDWGRSALATKAQNFFGIKASAGPGPAGIINMNTGEVINGASVMVDAAFKAYNTMEESFADHGVFLKSRARYATCFQTKDPKEFARRLQSAGYATDPAYASKLIAFMDKFNLYAYDLP